MQNFSLSRTVEVCSVGHVFYVFGGKLHLAVGESGNRHVADGHAARDDNIHNVACQRRRYGSKSSFGYRLPWILKIPINTRKSRVDSLMNLLSHSHKLQTG